MFLFGGKSRYLFIEIACKVFWQCESAIKCIKYGQDGLLNKTEYIKTVALNKMKVKFC